MKKRQASSGSIPSAPVLTGDEAVSSYAEYVVRRANLESTSPALPASDPTVRALSDLQSLVTVPARPVPSSSAADSALESISLKRRASPTLQTVVVPVPKLAQQSAQPSVASPAEAATCTPTEMSTINLSEPVAGVNLAESTTTQWPSSAAPEPVELPAESLVDRIRQDQARTAILTRTDDGLPVPESPSVPTAVLPPVQPQAAESWD